MVFFIIIKVVFWEDGVEIQRMKGINLLQVKKLKKKKEALKWIASNK